MSNLLKKEDEETARQTPLNVPIQRRAFFMYAGATAGATALLLSGCDDDDDDKTTPDPTGTTVDLGGNDVGILNYAYALEQLEAAFYAQVVATPYANIASEELTAMKAIAKHEAIHRDFFKAAIPADKRIGDLTPDFSKVNFADRASVLATAKAFEDLGVGAYNGAGPLIKNADYLLLAGKIVSVEARHAAYIRDLISNGSFAGSDVVNASGLDQALTVQQVLAAAQPFIKQTIKGDNVGK